MDSEEHMSHRSRTSTRWQSEVNREIHVATGARPSGSLEESSQKGRDIELNALDAVIGSDVDDRPMTLSGQTEESSNTN